MTNSPRAVLIDTSIAVELFRRNPQIQARFAQVQSVISSIGIGELYYGALKSMFTAKEMDYVRHLMQISRIIVCDEETSFQYATIRNYLRQQGQPIPENDMWIAAAAIQHGLPLAARDKHFDRVPGLIIERW